ncbi:hypothetical protein BH10CYA1_BH10CYA1_53910 [soil metagenome]
MATRDWKSSYKQDPDGGWVLPNAEQFAVDLRRCGGVLSKLVECVEGDDDGTLLFAVEEKLAMPGNELAREAWERACKAGQLAMYRSGVDRLLVDFRSGRVKHPTLLHKLGVTLMPDTFGIPAQRSSTSPVKSAAQLEAEAMLADLENYEELPSLEVVDPDLYRQLQETFHGAEKGFANLGVLNDEEEDE